uniref:Methyl farnesoate epoxidase n=1 Tax=Cacopsylla melanoneura TaxID=428564 RepID=A0A8D8Z881_9HEMI
MEIMRHGNTSPIGVAHRAVKTTRLDEFIIPQDSIVLVNIWSIMRDAEHWGDPDVFRPERFIHSETGEVIYDETLIPFGMGKLRHWTTFILASYYLMLPNSTSRFGISTSTEK